MSDGRRKLRSVCVFCGSSEGRAAVYRSAAQNLGRLLAKRRLELVYGGGSGGLMGCIADAALAAGGRVVGVIPRAMLEWEVEHRQLDEQHVVGSMHERKEKMHQLSDAFIAMPGGLGTLEELFEIWTWLQLGVHGKPVALLNVEGYWDPMITMLDRATEQGFIKLEQRRTLIVEAEGEAILDRFADFRDPRLRQWNDGGTGDGADSQPLDSGDS